MSFIKLLINLIIFYANKHLYKNINNDVNFNLQTIYCENHCFNQDESDQYCYSAYYISRSKKISARSLQNQICI